MVSATQAFDALLMICKDSASFRVENNDIIIKIQDFKQFINDEEKRVEKE